MVSIRARARSMPAAGLAGILGCVRWAGGNSVAG
jgi:hypothetical protein